VELWREIRETSLPQYSACSDTNFFLGAPYSTLSLCGIALGYAELKDPLRCPQITVTGPYSESTLLKQYFSSKKKRKSKAIPATGRGGL
jgi:hypothetical protein